jgi:hypothetical protein
MNRRLNFAWGVVHRPKGAAARRADGGSRSAKLRALARDSDQSLFILIASRDRGLRLLPCQVFSIWPDLASERRCPERLSPECEFLQQPCNDLIERKLASARQEAKQSNGRELQLRIDRPFNRSLGFCVVVIRKHVAHSGFGVPFPCSGLRANPLVLAQRIVFGLPKSFEALQAFCSIRDEVMRSVHRGFVDSRRDDEVEFSGRLQRLAE